VYIIRTVGQTAIYIKAREQANRQQDSELFMWMRIKSRFQKAIQIPNLHIYHQIVHCVDQHMLDWSLLRATVKMP